MVEIYEPDLSWLSSDEVGASEWEEREKRNEPGQQDEKKPGAV